jgi:iron complex outermembrane receptor protein
VLRGPQGTLYGRNAMGGVINIITKQPGNETSGFAELSAGNYGQQRYSAGLRTPLVKDKLFLGAALMYDGRNGYYTNEYTGGSYDKQHSFTGNYYLRWLAGRSWSVDLNVKHRANRNHGAFPLVADPSEVFAHPFVLNQNAVTTMVDNTFDASVALRYHGTAFNFSSQTSFQRNYRYYTKPIDGDFSPLDAISIINDYGRSWNNVKAWTEDIRFSSPATVGSRWKWTAGSYWFFQDQPNKQGTRYGIDANMLQVGDSLFTVINTTKNHRWGVAFYGQAGYALTDRLTLTAGLRYDYEHQWENVNEGYQHDPDPTVYTVLGDTSGRVAFHAFSPKLSLDYRLSDHAMGYVLYSKGFRTGGLTQLSSSPDQPPLAGFKPEYSDNYEAGLKSRVRDVLQLNLAVFYNHVSDVQQPTLILPDAITVTKNTGRMHAYGTELEMDWAPVGGVRLSYQFGYTHARYERSKAAGNETPPDLSGTHQLFTPDVTSMLAAQYGYGLGHGLRAVVRGEWKYIGTRYYATGDGLKESPYSLFNTRVGIEHKRGELMFWMRNIGNRKYVAYAYDFGAWHLGDPRTYGVTLLVRFHQG